MVLKAPVWIAATIGNVPPPANSIVVLRLICERGDLPRSTARALLHLQRRDVKPAADVPIGDRQAGTRLATAQQVAAMKHASTRVLFDYWTKLRGTRAAPERGEIDPSEIRLALGDTFMLAADFVDQLRFRLAGTRVCALFCREIKGEVFSETFSAASRKSIEELLAIVNEETVGAVAGLVARTEDGHEAELEMLLLPLAHSGHARIRALGVLAPAVPPYWLGEHAVAALDLVTLRHIGPEVKSHALPRFGRLEDGSRLRHGFVVHSGGRETPPGERTG
jgi:hypothetical protein